ncbi:zinc transporter ZIP10 [Cottoperca gobio]|uniref:Zinc transporter ZIP10 n=1 Tax=Cottoperca gobio TaxID=56716 RepID=A0A6J2RXN4_COTGO|nr:zinc transporter ZIP10 [Cottoperca gobio]
MGPEVRGQCESTCTPSSVSCVCSPSSSISVTTCHGEGHNHQRGGHPHADHDHVHSDLQISEAPYVRGATLSPVSKSPQVPTLEEEQRFYIQQLFRHYGQKDRLDFQGFQSLLFSLGLGEVKVVDTDHEELGHDHVAHLDLVDMMEGHHSHVSTNEGQGHGHGHPHHKPSPHHPPTEKNPTKCTQTTAASPAAGAPTGHDHNHDAEHTHDHTITEDSDHKHSDGHVKDTHGRVHNHDPAHDNEHKHEQVQVHSSHKDASSQPHGDHEHGDHEHRDHDHGEHSNQGHADRDHADHDHANHNHDHNHVPKVQTGTGVPPLSQEQLPSAQPEPSPAPQVPQTSPAYTESSTKKQRKPARVRGQRGRNKTPSLTPQSDDHDHDHDHQHDHDHSHSHSHKDKREAPGGPATSALPVPGMSGHPEGLSHQHEECLNLTQLLTYYGLNPESLISPSQFTYLCPALLYQIDRRVCIRHYHHMDVEQEALEPVSSVWVWLWGFVSITIISLLSLLGVVLVPILKQSCFKFLLTFLVALAVGTLSGDALLHLLPHSQGQHDHGEPATSDDTDLVTKFDGVWKGLTALAGIYLLFIIEHCIGMFKHYKDHRRMKKAIEEGKIGRKLSDHKLNRRSDAEWLHLKPLSEDPDGTAISCDNGHNDTQLTELQTPDSPTNKTPLAPTNPQPDHQSPTKENGGKAKQQGHSHGHGHSHGGNCHSDQEMKDAGIASIAWMVIMGDGMHNFSDGLAIGAAFSANLTGGISTSVAVFCHELPHELGDFAVLLKAGMSVKQAIFYNLLSALMAYVGMVIGTAVGQYTHSVTSWIFAITAGMFLYVALVDMLPEMLHGDSEDHKRCQLGHFILQNLGLLTGFGIMLLIAIFEDRIVFNFGF